MHALDEQSPIRLHFLCVIPFSIFQSRQSRWYSLALVKMWSECLGITSSQTCFFQKDALVIIHVQQKHSKSVQLNLLFIKRY